MGDSRKAEAGVPTVVRDVTLTIGAIAADETIDVAVPADLAWKQVQGVAVVPMEAVPANVASLTAWVSNATTGVVTVRVHADHTGFGGGDLDVRLTQQT